MKHDLFLGIDTSNYATSLSVFDKQKDLPLVQLKQFLKVKENSVGLRQSDAVFLHLKNFSKLYSELCETVDIKKIKAVGVSVRPRDVKGSYMPCFVAGETFAKTIATTLDVELFEFSHQLGHVAAARYGSGVCSNNFFCFHVSGGTFDLLYCNDYSDNEKRSLTLKATSLDVHAGQLVDRLGIKFGFTFPCGEQVSAAAQQETEDIKIPKPSLKCENANLSGIENRCLKLIEDGKSKEYVSKFCLLSIADTIVEMTKISNPENLATVFAGGVMCSETVKERIIKSGIEARFCEPCYSSDNAVGVALLAANSFN